MRQNVAGLYRPIRHFKHPSPRARFHPLVWRSVAPPSFDHTDFQILFSLIAASYAADARNPQ
jgi:hypothetical protein